MVVVAVRKTRSASLKKIEDEWKSSIPLLGGLNLSLRNQKWLLMEMQPFLVAYENVYAFVTQWKSA